VAVLFSEEVAQLRGAEAAGFDLSEAQAAKLLNQGIDRLAARSEWIKVEAEYGPTVAEQERYEIPANTVRVLSVQIGESPYVPVSVKDLWELKAGRKEAPAEGGVFAERFSEDGATKTLGFYPVPEEAEEAIEALAAITPAKDLSGEDPLPFPDQNCRGARDFAIALAYEQLDENIEQARFYEERGEAEAERLRRLANSRVGSGPLKIPVAGRKRWRR